MKATPLLILISLLLAPLVSAEDKIDSANFNKVFAKDGNIYYSEHNKNISQLTYSGKDKAPMLSPDSKIVAFIRKSNKEAYLAVGGEEDYTPGGLLADQVWIINTDGSNERMLVRDRKPDPINDKGDGITEELKKTIAHIDEDSLKFSPDSKKVYFISSAWVTSGAIHSVNVDGTDEKFLASGNSLEVINRGRYKGNLIVRQHKYFLVGGTYDWLWLISPEGKQIGPIGLNLDKEQQEFLYSD